MLAHLQPDDDIMGVLQHLQITNGGPSGDGGGVSQERKSAVCERECSILKGARRKRSAINEEFKNKRHHKKSYTRA